MKLFKLLSFALIASMALYSCSEESEEIVPDDFEEEEAAFEVTTSTTSLNIGSKVGAYEAMLVNTTASGAVITAELDDDSWASVSVDGIVVTVTATGANEGAVRHTYVTVSVSDGIESVITSIRVNQAEGDDYFQPTEEPDDPDFEAVLEKEYYAGPLAVYDIVAGGMVYWVSTDGTEAKVISLDEGKAVWSSKAVNVTGNNYSMTDGYSLSMSVLAYEGYTAELYPAVTSCTSRTDYDDWYLPSQTEVRAFLSVYTSNSTSFDAALKGAGGTALTVDEYFHSSNEDDDDPAAKNAVAKIKSDGTTVTGSSFNKTGDRYIRCMRYIGVTL